MKPTIKILFNLFTALCSVSFASVASAAATITYAPGALAAPVPTIGGTMLVALAVLLALIAFRLLKDRNHASSNLVIALAAATALASGASGITLISSAQAVSDTLDMKQANGGVINIPGPGFWIISNSTNVEQTITDIRYDQGCGPGRPTLRTQVDLSNEAEPTNTCDTSTTLAAGATESCDIEVFCDNDSDK